MLRKLGNPGQPCPISLEDRPPQSSKGTLWGPEGSVSQAYKDMSSAATDLLYVQVSTSVPADQSAQTWRQGDRSKAIPGEAQPGSSQAWLILMSSCIWTQEYPCRTELLVEPECAPPTVVKGLTS
ncbi:unnamed protein product [Arctogadus glacialis]